MGLTCKALWGTVWDMEDTLTIQRIEELARLEKAATPGPMCVERRDVDCGYIDYIVHGGPKGKDFAWCREELDRRARRNADLIAAMRNDLPALLEAARRLLELEGKLRGWMLDKRVSCAEAWCQSDRVNEALPELGEVIGDHLGYPEYDEETGELGWTPPGESK